jgi:hypothetical protein
MWRELAPIAAVLTAASAAWLWLRRSARGRDPGETAFVLWCGRHAFAPRPQQPLDPAGLPEPYRRLVQREVGDPRCVPAASLPEIEGSLFGQQFGWIVRAADGHGAAAFLARAPAPGRRSLTAAALVVSGSPRQPGLRVRASRTFEAPWFGHEADDSSTPALLAGRYVADGPAPLPEELVVELLDPHLPPLIVECLPEGLLVATAGGHLRTGDLDALAATTDRLTGLLLDDVATVSRDR